MPFPPLPDAPKDCEACGAPLTRKRYNGRLEDRGVFARRRFCGKACGSSRDVVTKDAHHWRARRHRAESCAECGTVARLHVHHVDRQPSNNDPANLVTLCASCHLRLHWREDRPARLAAAKRRAVA